jgi:hypothetical protein
MVGSHCEDGCCGKEESERDRKPVGKETKGNPKKIWVAGLLDGMKITRMSN